jgi:hypothetical protein
MTKLADASTAVSGGDNSAGGGSCFADVLVPGEVRFFLLHWFYSGLFFRESERESRWGLFWGGLYESVRMGFGIGFDGVRGDDDGWHTSHLTSMLRTAQRR